MSKSVKKLTVKETIELINKAEEEAPEIPWEVWTAFFDTRPAGYISGNMVSFGGDYKSLEEMQVAIQWMVEQLGGEVKW